MPQDPLEAAFVEARDSAVQAFHEYASGWRAKNPDAHELRVASLIASLSDDQRRDCALLVRYFTELSLFKLVSTLEAGIGESQFRLSAESAAGRIEFIEPDIDHDLVHSYWRWMHD